MNKEELRKRTYDFARRCVKLAMALPSTRLGKHIEGQLIRGANSVPAIYRAALVAQSKAALYSKDFDCDRGSR